MGIEGGKERGRTSGFLCDDVFVDHLVGRFFLTAVAGSLGETAGNGSIVKNTYVEKKSEGGRCG